MRCLGILLLALAVATAIPRQSQRIIGGSATTIDQYPEIATLLLSVAPVPFRNLCGGTILNNRSILTAAHCLATNSLTVVRPTSDIRIRLGSSYRSSGGLVYNSREFILYPDSLPDLYNDIAVIRVVGEIFQTDVIKYGMFAGPDYVVPDYAVVWAAGWGARAASGDYGPDQLYHAQGYYINHKTCNRLIQEFGHIVVLPEHKACFGEPKLKGDGSDGPSQCYGDSGGPLYHNGVVVGVTSFAHMGCGNPTTNDLVSHYIDWLEINI